MREGFSIKTFNIPIENIFLFIDLATLFDQTIFYLSGIVHHNQWMEKPVNRFKVRALSELINRNRKANQINTSVTSNYLITRILSGTLINLNIGHATFI